MKYSSKIRVNKDGFEVAIMSGSLIYDCPKKRIHVEGYSINTQTPTRLGGRKYP